MGVKGIYDGVTIKTGDDERATASAAVGHMRTKGDDRAYRAMRDYGGTATRPGVSGPPAPHHILGLKLWKGLTASMDYDEIMDFNDNYLLGRRLGDSAKWNLEAIEQDKDKGGMLTGWHKVVHDREKAVLEKQGFTKDANGNWKFLSQDFASLDPQLKKGLLGNLAMALEADFDEVQREAMADFKAQPPEVQQQQLDQIRATSESQPKRKPGYFDDPRMTSASAKVLSSKAWMEEQGPGMMEKMLGAERANKIRVQEMSEGNVRAHAAAVGVKLPLRGAIAGGVLGGARPGLADVGTLQKATQGDVGGVAADVGVGAATGGIIEAGFQGIQRISSGLANAGRFLYGNVAGPALAGGAIAQSTFADPKVQKEYAEAEPGLDSLRAAFSNFIPKTDKVQQTAPNRSERRGR